MSYTDDTWENKILTPRRTWADDKLQMRLDVPFENGARIHIALVGSRETGLVAHVGLVCIDKKKSGDYHGEMDSNPWLKWLEEKVLPTLQGGVPVVPRSPYHMKLTADNRLASSKAMKTILADGLESHDAVPDGWLITWRQLMTVMRTDVRAGV